MEQDDYVEGLTGDEIVNDILEQVEAKLRGDCNLRGSDAYDGGYEGTVEVRLKLRGFDLAEIQKTMVVGAPASVTLTGGTETGREDAEVKETDVEVRVEIPLEPRLNMVRERSGQGVPTATRDEAGQVVVKKRHYARKDTSKA